MEKKLQEGCMAAMEVFVITIQIFMQIQPHRIIVWQTVGYGSIIYVAALASVDMQIHEAAIIDGATLLQRIRYVDIPAILPTAVIMMILNMGRILNTGYEKILAMQNQMNLSTSEVISTYG